MNFTSIEMQSIFYSYVLINTIGLTFLLFKLFIQLIDKFDYRRKYEDRMEERIEEIDRNIHEKYQQIINTLTKQHGNTSHRQRYRRASK